MDNKFGVLFWDTICPKCKEGIILDLNNKKIITFGFVCPFCKAISTPEKLFQMFSKSRKKDNN